MELAGALPPAILCPLQWRLVCRYRQLAPVREIVAALGAIYQGKFSNDAQEWIVTSLLQGEFHTKFVRDAGYQRRLCKALMTAAEHEKDGVSDILASEFQQRQIQQQDEDESNWCRKVWTYGPRPEEAPESKHWERNPELSARLNHSFLCLDVSHDMLAGSTGCHEWEAGFWLAEFALNNPALFRARRCLELGAGAGIVGVILARLGAQSVICTDGSAEAVRNCQHNLELNNGGNSHAPEITTAILRWGSDLPEDLGLSITPPDVVLGSDLLYDPEAVAPLLETFAALLSLGNGAGTGYLVTTCRNPATLELFERAAAKHPLLVVKRLEGSSPHQNGNQGRDIRWHHLDALENARDRIVIHQIRSRRHGKG